MNISDFYPVNRWAIDKSDKFVVDKATGKRYSNESASRLTALHIGLTVLTPIVQTAVAISFVCLRLLKLITFWHLWKEQQEPYNFKARLEDAGKDLLKIFTAPLSILLLEIVAFYGIASSFNATKLYCSIEQFQYDQYMLTSLLKMAPLPPEPSQPSNRVKSQHQFATKPTLTQPVNPVKPQHPNKQPAAKPTSSNQPKAPKNATLGQNGAPNSKAISANLSNPQIKSEAEKLNMGIYEDIDSFCSLLSFLQDDENWNSITFEQIDTLIKANLTLITSQTENEANFKAKTQELQDLLLKLSTKINEKFDRASGHDLAFTVQGIAQGILGPGFNWNEVPEEVKLVILQQFTSRNDQHKSKTISSGLVDYACTAKASKELAIQAKRDWADRETVSLETFGYREAKQAIDYVISHRLSSANLLGFYVSKDDLKRLIEARPDLEHLLIYILDVNDDKIGIIEELEKIPDKVRGLQIESAGLPKWLLGALEKFNRLEHFDLSQMSFYQSMSDEWAQAIGKLTSLRSIKTPFTLGISSKQLLVMLQDLTHLTNLDLSRGRKFDIDNLLECLQHVPNVRNLNLSKSCSEIPEGNLLPAVATLTKLQSLNLAECRQITAPCLAETMKKLPLLKELNLSSTGKWEVFGARSWGKDLAPAFESLSGLEILDFSNNRMAKGSGNALKHLTALRKLSLKNVFSEEGNEIAEGLLHLTALEELDLSEANIKGEDFIDGIGKLKGLRILNLRKFVVQDNLGIEKLANALGNLTRLRELNLDGCSDIPWELLKPILAKLTDLQILSLDGCKQIPWRELEPILKKMPYLRNKLTKDNLVYRVRSQVYHRKSSTLCVLKS